MDYQPVTGPSAWKGAQLSDDPSWKVALDAGEAAELGAALRHFKGTGLPLEAIEPLSFPLPSLGARIGEWRRELADGRGFLLLRGFPLDGYSTEDIRALYIGFGSHLGVPISQNSFGELVGDIVDERLELQPGSFEGSRGYRGRGPLLFHTDRADVVGLLCVQPAKEGGLSCLMSAMAVYNAFLAEHPELVPTLHAGFITPNSDERSDGSTPRTPMFSIANGVVSCRISRNAVNRGRAAGLHSTPEEGAALAFLDELAERDDVRLDMDFRRGDIQLVNNFTILHSRTGYDDHPDPALRRHLVRLWLRLAQRRPFDARYFADYDGIPKALSRS